jgi:ketosteroid isomerase-like protein
VQLISTYVFYDNHWDAMSRRMTQDLAGDIAAVSAAMIEFKEPAQRDWFVQNAMATMELEVSLAPGARLERLETVEAARDCLYRYADGVDARDWTLLRSAFATDAVLVMPGSETAGADAIVAGLRSMLPAEFITRHLIVNPRVEYLEPGRARVRATIYYAHEGTGFEATGWGDYIDDVSVTDGIGVITRKEFVPAQHLPGSHANAATRLAELETAELAREASWRYAVAIDTGDFELLASVFTEDAVLVTRRGSQEGRAAIVDYYRTALADPVARKHVAYKESKIK